jgi:hypothetical protein
MLKPICVTCGTFFKPARCGIRVQEMRPRSEGAVAGKLFATDWVPYKLWQADLYECRSCGMQIVVGSGMNPISEHYKPDYEKMVDEHPPEVDVYDC